MSGSFRIVAFGDSMTLCSRQAPARRWTSLLQARLNRAFPGRRFEVINAGVGGNTSREGLARLEPDVLARRPHLTLVEFGGNDATTDPARAVSLAEFRRNLNAMHRRLRAAGSDVAWVSFPPVVDLWHASGGPDNAAAREKFLPAGGLNSFVHAYRRITRDLARRHAGLFVDLYAGIRDAIEEGTCSRYILPDGVHFTDAGCRQAAAFMFAALRPRLARTFRARVPRRSRGIGRDR